MYQGEVSLAEEDLPCFLEVVVDLNIKGLSKGNMEGFDSVEAGTKQFTHKNIKMSPITKGNVENNKKNTTNDNKSAISSSKLEESYDNLINIVNDSN